MQSTHPGWTEVANAIMMFAFGGLFLQGFIKRMTAVQDFRTVVALALPMILMIPAYALHTFHYLGLSVAASLGAFALGTWIYSRPYFASTEPPVLKTPTYRGEKEDA